MLIAGSNLCIHLYEKMEYMGHPGVLFQTQSYLVRVSSQTFIAPIGWRNLIMAVTYTVQYNHYKMMA